jgi:uncharacterized protein YoxC
MIIEISILVVSIAVLALILFLIPSIIQLRRSAKRIEEVSEQLNQQLPSILKNIDEITTNLNGMMSNGRQHVEKLGNAVDDIVDFEKRIKHRVEDPLVETLTTIAAITKAVRAFLTIFLDRK